MSIEELLNKCEEAKNLAIFDSFIKSASKIETKQRIVGSISGGSDSDIVLDLWVKLDNKKKTKYVFFDTGIELEANKKHLDFLEKKYDIKIERLRAVKTVPYCCHNYGVPFWSKHVSDMIERLQRHNFKWEDKPFNELIKEYPKCKGSLRWWCNDFGEGSRFNINYVKWLKEFMVLNPPTFKISPKCCQYAKKNISKKYLIEQNADLHLLGVRKSEGGIRSTAYKSCFDLAKGSETWDKYRPIFWFTEADKKQYEEMFGIVHSKCYSTYGLSRTGCAGCPFGKDFEYELKVIEEHEPKLYKAVNKIFGDSYEYTRAFYKFREERALKGGAEE